MGIVTKRYQRYQFAQPTSRDVRPVDPVLTDLSIGFRNDRFLWDKIAPVKETPLQTGTIPTYTRDFWFRRQEGAERAPESPYTRVGYGVSTATYTAIEYGFEKLVDDVVRSASQLPDNLDALATAFVTNLLQLELEKLAAAEFFAASKWGTDTTLSGVNQWSDFANSDPIKDVDTAKRTIRRATGATNMFKGFIGALGWEKLKEHPLILDKYKHTQVGVMTEALVAGVLGLDELVVGDSVENTAKEGATYIGADIWTDNIIIAVTNNPGLMVPNGGVSFVWNERGNVPWAVESYREEEKRSDVVRAFTHYVAKVVSSEHGYRYADLVA